jgi:FKBP-type peptidyl-prolyl cis-trans isomerase (trigger factor)
MVERYIEGVLGDTSKADPAEVEQAREQIRPDAELGVKRMMLISRVADQHGLRSTTEDLSARIADMAERSGTTPAQVRAQLEKADRLDSLERELTDRKVFAFLREQSEIRDEA